MRELFLVAGANRVNLKVQGGANGIPHELKAQKSSHGPDDVLNRLTPILTGKAAKISMHVCQGEVFQRSLLLVQTKEIQKDAKQSAVRLAGAVSRSTGFSQILNVSGDLLFGTADRFGVTGLEPSVRPQKVGETPQSPSVTWIMCAGGEIVFRQIIGRTSAPSPKPSCQMPEGI
jgi:hypothetical protein